jgi:hypothetical protein
MPITQTGSVLQFPALGDGNTGIVSTTITVPGDATMVIAGWSGFGDAGGYFSGGKMQFTKDGVDTDMVPVAGGDASHAQWMAAMFYLILPDTGLNKTLKWDWSGAGLADDADSLCSVTFWKGVDTVSPVRGTGGAQANSPPYTTGTITAALGDLFIAWAACFAGGAGEETANSWSNLSLLSQITHSGSADAAWATGSPSGDSTVALSTGSVSWDDGGIVCASFKAAAEVASDSTILTGMGPIIYKSSPRMIPSGSFKTGAPHVLL